ncbi:MAG: YgaC family protein [bacterium]|nr:YgaC family protein [bacterium]
MEKPILYRRRLIPDECISLEDDVILRCDSDMVVTSWNTFRPKKDFDHGASVYYLKKGIKVSKFLRNDGSLAFWYCDIVDYEYGNAESVMSAGSADREAAAKEPDKPQKYDRLTCIDLLADVIVFPDGFVKVVDLDELAEAAEHGLISEQTLHSILLRVNELLQTIYNGDFETLTAPLEQT